MNITWQEIRDIIEDKTYIGSGTILGAADAARAIKTLIETIETDHQSMSRTDEGVNHE